MCAFLLCFLVCGQIRNRASALGRKRARFIAIEGILVEWRCDTVWSWLDSYTVIYDIVNVDGTHGKFKLVVSVF